MGLHLTFDSMKQQVDWKKLATGLERYKEIMALYKCSDNIAKDELFQRKFKSFYRMGKKPPEYYKVYFRTLEQLRQGKELSMRQILETLYRVEHRKEFSFASKMLATHDPTLPVWDSKVRKQINQHSSLHLKQLFKSIDECVEAYAHMVKWYKAFMRSEEAHRIIREFDDRFPGQKIKAIKKVDLVLWQTR